MNFKFFVYILVSIFCLGANAQTSSNIYEFDNENAIIGIDYSDLLYFGYSWKKDGLAIRHSFYTDKFSDQIIQLNYYRHISKNRWAFMPTIGLITSYNTDFKIPFLGNENIYIFNKFKIESATFLQLNNSNINFTYQIGVAYDINDFFGIYLNEGTNHIFNFSEKALESGIILNSEMIRSRVFLQIPTSYNLHHLRLLVSLVFSPHKIFNKNY